MDWTLPSFNPFLLFCGFACCIVHATFLSLPGFSLTVFVCLVAFLPGVKRLVWENCCLFFFFLMHFASCGWKEIFFVTWKSNILAEFWPLLFIFTFWIHFRSSIDFCLFLFSIVQEINTLRFRWRKKLAKVFFIWAALFQNILCNKERLFLAVEVEFGKLFSSPNWFCLNFFEPRALTHDLLSGNPKNQEFQSRADKFSSGLSYSCSLLA